LGAVSGLFGSKASNTSKVDNTTTSTPNLTPENQSFQDQLINMYKQLVGGAGSGEFQQAYTTGGLKNINNISNINANAINNILASRGLSRTGAGASAANSVALNGANRTAGFLNSVPLTMDQRFQDILKQAGGYQASIPVGNTQHQVGTVANTSTGGGGFGGAVSGGASGLATILGQQSANNSFANVLKSLGLGGGGPTTSAYPNITYNDGTAGHS